MAQQPIIMITNAVSLAVWLLIACTFSAVIADVPGLRFIRHPESTVALPGSEVILECALNVSADRVEWRHRGEPILLPSSRSSGRFVVPLATQPSEYAAQTGTYQCVAWFGASAMASLIADLQVARLQEPLSSPTQLQPDIYQVAPGNVVALSCPPPPSNPPAQVHFARNGQPITAHVSKLGSLLLTNVTRADSGLYTCSASNPLTHDTVPLSTKIDLRVEATSTSKALHFLAPRVNNYTVIAGSDAMLECPAVGWPTPTTTWSKYGGSLPRNRTALLPGALHLSSITQADEGTYVCEANNSVGSPVSCVIMLHVLEAPTILKDPASMTVEEGGEVKLDCAAKGHPNPAISWMHNGSPVAKDPHITTNGPKLHILQVEKRHAGIFQCFATNALGSAFGLAMLQVQPRPVSSRPHYYGPDQNGDDDIDDLDEPSRGRGHRPDRVKKPKHKNRHRGAIMIPPSRPNITRLTDESVMVRWSVPSDEGLPIQFFKVQYRDLGRRGAQWMTIDADIPPHIRSYEVDSLKTDHAYRFRIAAVYSNNDNKLGANSVRFHLQKEPATKRPLFPPTLSHAEAVSPSAIEIEWQYTEVPSTPIEGFFIYYRSTTMAGDYSKATVLGENTRSFLITHLLPDNSYDIKMQSFNLAGASDFSAIRSYRTQYVPTTPEPGSAGSRSPSLSGGGGFSGPSVGDSSSHQLGLVIGVVLGGLLLLLLLLSLGVYICRQTGSRTAAAEHDQAKEVQAYGLAAVGKPLTNGHLHLHHRHLGSPRVHITANPLAATADHYKSDGELEVSGQNNNCSALLEPARRRLEAADDSQGEEEEDDGLSEEEPPLPRGHCENYV